MRLLLSIAAFALLALPGQTRTFVDPIRLVPIYATVRDSNGGLVPHLTASDFLVFDNGKPVPVVAFKNEVVPVTAVLMLDMSGSTLKQYQRIIEATTKFIDVLQPVDRVRLGSFGDEVAVSPLLTGDKGILHRVLREEFWPSNTTPLWQGLETAMHSLDHETGRRVVIVVTGARDTCQCEDADAGAQANAGDFLVYAVSLEGSSLSREMTSLVDTAGGDRIDVSQHDNLGLVLAEVVDELHGQYALGVASAHDGLRHTIKVQVQTPHLSVRARQAYDAVK